jgi:hypothetical protein
LTDWRRPALSRADARCALPSIRLASAS